MKEPTPKRQALLESMAAHVLEHGLQAASLRPLAAAVGTSDRMLLYYFADKDELIAATLAHIGQQLVVLLDNALPGPKPYAKLLPAVCELLRGPALKPYMTLWLELAALAARDKEPYKSIAGQLCDGFLAWTASRLRVTNEADRLPTAALLLSTVDGLLLIDAIGRPAVVTQALRRK